jgi:hypothetical protein
LIPYQFFHHAIFLSFKTDLFSVHETNSLIIGR